MLDVRSDVTGDRAAHQLSFAGVMMNYATSCTPITASARPHRPVLGAVLPSSKPLTRRVMAWSLAAK
jgi:hypothetical protein